MMEDMLHTLVLLTFKNLMFRVTDCREELSLTYSVKRNNGMSSNIPHFTLLNSRLQLNESEDIVKSRFTLCS